MSAIKRILLVDDDTDDRLYFRDAINEIRPSLQFEMATNGREALEQIEVPPPPDLIFLDLNMPIMNGYECLEALKNENRFKDIPVVIFTTSKNTKDIEITRRLGATIFMTKPSDFAVLCEKLAKILNMDLRTVQFVHYN